MSVSLSEIWSAVNVDAAQVADRDHKHWRNRFAADAFALAFTFVSSVVHIDQPISTPKPKHANITPMIAITKCASLQSCSLMA